MMTPLTFIFTLFLTKSITAKDCKNLRNNQFQSVKESADGSSPGRWSRCENGTVHAGCIVGGVNYPVGAKFNRNDFLLECKDQSTTDVIGCIVQEKELDGVNKMYKTFIPKGAYWEMRSGIGAAVHKCNIQVNNEGATSFKANMGMDHCALEYQLLHDISNILQSSSILMLSKNGKSEKVEIGCSITDQNGKKWYCTKSRFGTAVQTVKPGCTTS